MIPLKLVAHPIRQLFVSAIDNDASPSSPLAMFILDGHLGLARIHSSSCGRKRVKMSIQWA
jgi:hypothetical protein